MAQQSIRPYTVSLRLYPGLPSRDRLMAEERFCAALENMLLGCQAVLRGHAAFCVPQAEGDAPVDLAFQSRWYAAVQAARATALRALPPVPQAYFEIALVSPAPAAMATERGARRRTVRVAPVPSIGVA